MVMRPRMVRRRPLLRAAAVGGTFAAGRATGRRAEEQQYAAADQNQPAGDMQAGQAGQAGQGGQGGPAPAADAGQENSVMEQLSQLATMHDQGALTDQEFAAAKAKVLGG
jgi:Short C-terminal domain